MTTFSLRIYTPAASPEVLGFDEAAARLRELADQIEHRGRREARAAEQGQQLDSTSQRRDFAIRLEQIAQEISGEIEDVVREGAAFAQGANYVVVREVGGANVPVARVLLPAEERAAGQVARRIRDALTAADAAAVESDLY